MTHPTLADSLEAGAVEMQRELLEAAADILLPKKRPSKPGFVYWCPNRRRFDGLAHVGAYVDAAMMLKPQGLRLLLSEWDDEAHLRAKGPWQAVLSRPGCDASFDAMRGYRCDHAATPALAIAAAALRAHAHSTDGENSRG